MLQWHNCSVMLGKSKHNLDHSLDLIKHCSFSNMIKKLIVKDHNSSTFWGKYSSLPWGQLGKLFPLLVVAVVCENTQEQSLTVLPSVPETTDLFRVLTASGCCPSVDLLKGSNRQQRLWWILQTLLCWLCLSDNRTEYSQSCWCLLFKDLSKDNICLTKRRRFSPIFQSRVPLSVSLSVFMPAVPMASVAFPSTQRHVNPNEQRSMAYRQKRHLEKGAVAT